MSQLLYLLPVLACPIGMGLMMWFMMRSKRPTTTAQPPHAAPTSAQELELLRLRKEVDALRGELDTKPSLHKDSPA